MSLQRMMPWLIALLVATVPAMMIAARAGLTTATSAFAAAFAVVLVAVSWRTNAGHWTAARPAHGAMTALEPVHAARRNARLTGLTYAWGALGMMGLYTTPLTGLKWQHGWQYATVFGLLSVGALAYTHFSGSRNAALRRRLLKLAGPLSAAQATIAAAGLAFLVMSGKLQSMRADWAANVIFLYAALTIMIIGAVALRTHIVLMRDPT
jgi:hypothetical protein